MYGTFLKSLRLNYCLNEPCFDYDEPPAQFLCVTTDLHRIIDIINVYELFFYILLQKITSTVRLNTVPANPDGVMVTITRNECGYVV